MTDTPHPTETPDLATELRETLAELVRRWPLPDTAPAQAGAGRVHGPRTPLPDRWWVRQGIADDIAHWTRLALEDQATPALPADADTRRRAAHLLQHTDTLAAWPRAHALAATLRQDLRKLRTLTTEAPRGVTLEHSCGGLVLVAPDDGDELLCPHCGHRLAFREDAQAMAPVTAEQLALVLRRIGIRVSRVGVRVMASRGQIPPPCATDAKGRALYAVAPTLQRLLQREALPAAQSV